MPDGTNDDDELESLKELTPEEAKNGVKAYEKEETLRTLYHDRDWSQGDIADFFNVDQSTISRAMDKADIETRPPMHERERKGLYRSVGENGRVQYVVDSKGEKTAFYESQLVALLDNDPHEVFDPGSHVHHILSLGIYLNHPDNLLVLDADEHRFRHSAGPIPRYLVHSWIFGEIPESVREHHQMYRVVNEENDSQSTAD